ncbi:MAG TPA: hypothetical protein VEP90_27575 [Methylomirabilota bacterium]|nr:hypothetical protein [Methylomirabilota bacterium]
MSQQNNRGRFEWMRDPIWQFIGVVVATLLTTIGIIISLLALPQAAPIRTGISQVINGAPSSTAIKTSPTPGTQPTTTETYWGLLGGDSITVNKMLTCGAGCPDPLHMRINSIQIDKTNNYMTWDIHFSDPTRTVRSPSFDVFALQSDITPETQATQNQIDSVGSLQAKFPFVPVPNDIYTLIVTASYHTGTSGGGVSIGTTSINFSPVQMLFNP